MTLRQTLLRARALLAAAGIDEAPIEAEVLLRHALGMDRVRFFLEFENEIAGDGAPRFDRIIERRLSGEPAAYIIGKREFYGREYYVNRQVLIPRPETELLVEKSIDFARKKGASSMADIGTGCGAIAVALAASLPLATVYAIDLSPEALEVAGRNCTAHDVSERVKLLQGDLLSPLPTPVDIIAANLPYVRTSDLPATGEPRLALDGGADGLDQVRRLCRQAPASLKRPGALLLEIGLGQKDAVAEMLRLVFPASEIECCPDLAGIPRVVGVYLP